jgi:hypothetical protein
MNEKVQFEVELRKYFKHTPFTLLLDLLIFKNYLFFLTYC